MYLDFLGQLAFFDVLLQRKYVVFEIQYWNLETLAENFNKLRIHFTVSVLPLFCLNHIETQKTL